MTYIFDEHLSPYIASLLKQLGADVSHLFDKFGSGAQDEDFLPKIGQSGDVLVTYDNAMRRYTGKHGHGAILHAYKVKVLFLPKSFQTHPSGIPASTYPSVSWAQCVWMLRYWHEVDRNVSQIKRLFLVRITDRGKVEIIEGI